MNIMTLPPKMAIQFAEKAKGGLGYPLGDMFLFRQGTQEICLFGHNDPQPFGSIKKLTLDEAASWDENHKDK